MFEDKLVLTPPSPNHMEPEELIIRYDSHRFYTWYLIMISTFSSSNSHYLFLPSLLPSLLLSSFSLTLFLLHSLFLLSHSPSSLSLTISYPLLLSHSYYLPLTLSLLPSFPPSYSPFYPYLLLFLFLLFLTIRARGQLYRGLFRVFMAASDMLIFPPLDR